ncbi:formate dehydrogenase subunit delta [Ideonella sp. YS5]|uniref:formate dehydrogenase subunit delta n=1 Tax=Ideonella sp. YS5 TaxID=3453714 RepID=UPI003EEF796A
MHTEHLIQMANSIGDFFAAMPDADEARADLATHIQRFWEPRMRRGILEHLDKAHGEGLNAIVLQALQQHRARLA